MSYIVSTSILGIQTFVTRFDPSGPPWPKSRIGGLKSPHGPKSQKGRLRSQKT